MSHRSRQKRSTASNETSVESMPRQQVPQVQHPPKAPGWTAQTWVSLSSALIALCALAFTMYQGYSQRQFQRLSIRPRMALDFFYDDEGAGFRFGGTGAGYATLKTFEVLVDGKPQSNWANMLRALGFSSIPEFEFLVPDPDSVYGPNSFKQHFWIRRGPQAEELKLKIDRILIKACYCSASDECWIADSHSGLTGIASCPKSEIAFRAPSTSR
jgi:hypothetical protein